MMKERQLGPIIGATLLTQDIGYVITSYQSQLGFRVQTESNVSNQLASLWNTPSLVGNKMAILASTNGDSWLRVVEDPSAKPATPLESYGWMALETNVASVDNIREKFTNDSFTVIGEPAYLQISDAIKAMQVVGPAGEVSYLTQVDREVPPFELPMTWAETGSLFIPVLCTPSREQSLAFYQQLNDADNGLCFDTKITVLNNAWGHDIEHQYPVATLQLDGKCLFEIDQVEDAKPLATNNQSLPSGIALVTCKVKNIEAIAKQFNVKIHTVNDYYYGKARVVLLTGPAGERIEFVG
jgi:hypothetical protein